MNKNQPRVEKKFLRFSNFEIDFPGHLDFSFVSE